MGFILAMAASVIGMVWMASSASTSNQAGDWNRRFRTLEIHLNGDAEAPAFIREYFDRDDEDETTPEAALTLVPGSMAEVQPLAA